jgi:phosphatidylglycerol:prolipoprotein diacylglycerol transferase
MYPVLFETDTWLGHWTVHTSGVLVAIACSVALLVTASRARQSGLDQGRLIDVAVLLLIAGFIGAKLMLGLVEYRFFMAEPSAVISLAFFQTAGVFYGGLLGAMGVAWWLIPRVGLPFWATADFLTPSLALGQIIGRVGCLFAGCCFGRRTNVPWAFTFTNPAAAAHSGTPLNVPLHPTALYDAFAAATFLLVFFVGQRRGRAFAGRTFWMYVLVYAVSRAVIELYRGDSRSYLVGLSVSQIASLIAAPVAVIMLFRLSRRATGKPRSAHATP